MNRYKITFFLPFPGNYHSKSITIYGYDILEAIEIAKRMNVRFWEILELSN